MISFLHLNLRDRLPRFCFIHLILKEILSHLNSEDLCQSILDKNSSIKSSAEDESNTPGEKQDLGMPTSVS